MRCEFRVFLPDAGFRTLRCWSLATRHECSSQNRGFMPRPYVDLASELLAPQTWVPMLYASVTAVVRPSQVTVFDRGPSKSVPVRPPVGSAPWPTFNPHDRAKTVSLECQSSISRTSALRLPPETLTPSTVSDRGSDPPSLLRCQS